MGQTKYYSMSFFDFGERLESPLNIQKEIDRFVIVDKQLYGLYNVFGNGVINGWTVRDGGFTNNEGITITISQGNGIINYMAAESQIPSFVYTLTPNSILDIYATVVGTTVRDRIVSFFASTSSTLSSTSTIRIARLATSNNSILYIDNNQRDLVSFEDIIEDQINLHKHRGTPTKVDLKEEVKNQLSGARIDGIDGSKITSGQFNIDRIPLIDHNDLENNGMLTHAALDSFVKTFSQNNRELLGEISSVNLMKTIIFLKYLYTTVDEQFVNELAIIPGISPDSFIDFESSTANIDLEHNCISGVPTSTGIYSSIYWNSTYSFNTAVTKNNVLISNDEIVLKRTGENIDIVNDFNQKSFQPEMIATQDDQNFTIVTEDGNNIGRIGGGGDLTYYYRLNFDINSHRNWDGIYDELVIKVKTSEQIHEPVYMYVVNGSNVVSNGSSYGSIEAGNIDGIKKPTSSWVLLQQNETMSELEEKTFNISGLGLDSVSQITIYTSDDFTFDIDDILARRTNLVSDSGNVRFRTQSESNVVFHSIYYDATTPEDTSVEVRIKSASSTGLLDRAGYSKSLNSGDIFGVEGMSSEIEIRMTSNTENTVSPTFNSLELRILANSDYNGFVIDTKEEWNRGTLENVNTSRVSGTGLYNVVQSTPINVDGRYFAKNSSVSEINDENIGVYGFSGSLMPVSPNQARSWSQSSSRGFSTVSSVVRKFNKNFLVADLNNNRVMEIDSAGNLIKGFGSTYSIDSSFYPLSATYNSDSKILSLVFTKAAIISDITKIHFYVGSVKVSLSTDDTIISVEKAGKKILEIQLSDVTAANLTGITSNLSVNFDSGAFTDSITVNEGMSSQGNSIFSNLRGIFCFVGNFTYIDNIRHPVFVNETESGNWMIANSSIFYKEVDPTKEESIDIPDVIEIDPDAPNDVTDKLNSSDIKFSDYSLGSILEYEKEKFIIAGISESSSTITGGTSEEFLSNYSSPISENIKFRGAAIDGLAGYVGKIVLIDKNNNRSQVFYTSSSGTFCSDISEFSNGDFLISESSFASNSGRLVKIDSFGNIVFTYLNGVLAVVNDAKVLNNDKIIISV